MIRTLCALSITLLAAPAAAEPAPTPAATLTPAQISTLGDVVPSGGFAHFAGHGGEACPMPVMYASGSRPWKLTIVARQAREFRVAAGSETPDLKAVQAVFRATVAGCGLPTPPAAEKQPLAKGSPSTPRKMDPKMMAPLPPAATMAYLAGLGRNFHNLPAVFAMRHDEQPILVVAGKGHPMKSFALPGEWGAAMKAYAALLAARGYR